jgi:ArsR family transcriptional regulator
VTATTLPLTRSDELCCASVTGAVISAAEAARLALAFKALSDPTRIRLLSLIAATEGGEACVCDLTEPVALSQPTVSHHMKQLVEAGLVTREQRGKWAYYRVVDDALRAISAALITPTP